MKFLCLSVLFLSLNVSAQLDSRGQAKSYEPNNGMNPPGTFESKKTTPSVDQKKSSTTTAMDIQEQETAPTSSETGIRNSSGVTTDQMNTSPNTPPTTDQDLMRDTTLSKDPTNPGEIQAQDEENALDYSTTPQKNKKK